MNEVRRCRRRSASSGAARSLNDAHETHPSAPGQERVKPPHVRTMPLEEYAIGAQASANEDEEENVGQDWKRW